MKKTFRKPYRIKKKRSILKNRFFWRGILAFAIFIGFIYLFYFASFFQIKETKISGNQKIRTEDLEDIIENQINQKMIFLQTRSIVLANSGQIKEELQNSFPQIAEVEVEKDLPSVLVVKVKERKPVAVFCQNENQFLIDENGIIFEKIEDQNFELLMIKNQILSSEVKIKEKVFEDNVFSQILDAMPSCYANVCVYINSIQYYLKLVKLNAEVNNEKGG